MTTLAVLGTGLLGSGFVENLLRKGHRVRAWNRSPQKLQPLVQLGAIATDNPADAVRGAERVHLILAEDAAVDSVVAALRPGLGHEVPILDHSTNLPAMVAQRFERLRRDQVRYLHAPVFMAPQHAREGSGLMLLAGPQAEAEALQPELAQMTGKVWHVGERPELAAIFKLTGNGLLVGLTGVMGDLLAMGQKNGLDAEQVLSLFNVFKPGGALGFFGQRVVQAGREAPSFELTMARKDVRLMLETAGGPADLVVLPAIAAAMDQALAKGHGSDDYAIFARRDAR